MRALGPRPHGSVPPLAGARGSVPALNRDRKGADLAVTALGPRQPIADAPGSELALLQHARYRAATDRKRSAECFTLYSVLATAVLPSPAPQRGVLPILLCILLLFATTAFAQPKRIISTAPSITEMLFALGLGPRVVGVTSFCTYPPEAASKAKIGGYYNPSIEAILALRPDLVAVLKDPSSLATRLRGMGLNAIELDHREVYSISGIYSSIEQLGKAAGVPDRARELVAAMRKDLEAVRARTAPLPRRRVMFLVGRTPRTLEGLIAVGKGSFINEVIEIAGGENIFRDAVASYPKVSIEEILARNPDIIVDMGDVPRASGITEAHKQSVVALWGRYPALKAVRQGGVHAVAADVLVVAGPRAAEAARIFARMFHPEAGF